jgi:hypothetical protein
VTLINGEDAFEGELYTARGVTRLAGIRNDRAALAGSFLLFGKFAFPYPFINGYFLL